MLLKYITWIFIFVLTLFLSNCATDKEKKSDVLQENEQLNIFISFPQKLKKADELKRKGDIILFYKEREYRPVWSDDFKITPAADSLFFIFSNALSYGLDTADYHFPQLREIRSALTNSSDTTSTLWLDWEMLMTDTWLVFGKHIAEGRLDFLPEDSLLQRNRLTVNQVELLKHACENKSELGSLLSLQPQHPEYHNLQRALAAYVKTTELNDSTFKVPGSKSDSTLAYSTAIKVLHQTGHLNKDSTQYEAIQRAIKKFQVMHGLTADGKIGMNTAAELSVSNLSRYKKAAASLEQWRWMKIPLENYHVIVNIPAFTLKVYNDDSLQREHKVIVGNPKAPTPVLKSHLGYFITYPFWYVPHSITSKELLPKIRNDSTYLARNNYEVIGKGQKIIDPSLINWEKTSGENFPYMLRQKSGSKNALGLIKFMFHNKYSVYLHDTPTKSLFNLDIRTFSHGCIRLQKPLEFTDYLLKTDSNETPVDTIISLINRQESKTITLRKPVPIYIQYITCTGNNDGSIIFHKDVYGYEQKLIKRMFPEK